MKIHRSHQIKDPRRKPVPCPENIQTIPKLKILAEIL